jgi:hypothetical protein
MNKSMNFHQRHFCGPTLVIDRLHDWNPQKPATTTIDIRKYLQHTGLDFALNYWADVTTTVFSLQSSFVTKDSNTSCRDICILSTFSEFMQSALAGRNTSS